MLPINRDAILRIIVALHFVLSSLVLMVGWLPTSYLLSQAVIIILGLWAISNRDGVIQVELLMVIKAFSFVLDIIAIGMYFESNRLAYELAHNSSYFVFSAFFAIILLILKPIMLLLLNIVRQDRLGGDASPTFGQWGKNTGHVPGYQPVDGSSTPSNNP